MITRLKGWPEKMMAEIKAARTREFEYGTHDCCAFSGRVVKAMTGVDMLADWKDYATQDEADALLVSKGEGTLTRTADKLMKAYGCEQTPAPLCRRGDPVIAKIDVGGGRKERAIGICVGAVAVFPMKRGTGTVSMANVIRGWRVG